MQRATTALFLLVAIVIAAAADLSIIEDSLAALGVRVGIAEYIARVNSRLIGQGAALDLLTFTATTRGVYSAERGQSPHEVPIYIEHGSAQVQLWPLIRRQVVLDEVAVSGVNVQLEIDRQNRVNLEELSRIVNDNADKPSPWNVNLHQFAVDHATVNLAFHDQPVRASLARMAFRGFLTVQPLQVHAVEGAHVGVGLSAAENLSADVNLHRRSTLEDLVTIAYRLNDSISWLGCGMSAELLASMGNFPSALSKCAHGCSGIGRL